MISQQEHNLIKKFIIKAKQERYLAFLDNPKLRHKFRKELYHFKDFDSNLFQELQGNENVREIIATRINRYNNIPTCFVISANALYDGKTLNVDEAIENVIGIEGTILIFGNADLVYYEGEAPKNRLISQ